MTCIEILNNTPDWISAIATVGGTIIAYIVYVYVKRTFGLQKKQLLSQEKELEETRKHIVKQQFETVFFNMLQNLNFLKAKIEETDKDFFVKIINLLKKEYVLPNCNEISSIKFNTQNALLNISRSNDLIFHLKTEQNPSINNFVEAYVEIFNKWRNESIENEKLYVGFLFLEIFNVSESENLAHLLRFLNQTVKYVMEERRTYKDEEKYIGLIQQYFSAFQLVVIFYDTISPTNNKGNWTYSQILDEYQFFSDIPEDLLIVRSHKEFYQRTHFKGNYPSTKWIQTVTDREAAKYDNIFAKML